MNANMEAQINLSIKTQWGNVVTLWVIGIFAAMQFAKFSIAYDSLLAMYHVKPTLIGFSVSSVGVVGLLFGAAAGVVFNTLSYRSVLITSLIIGAGTSLIQSMTPNFSIILISRFIEGLSQLGIVVAAPTLMLKTSEPRHHALVMGLWGTFFGVAFTVAGGLGNHILKTQGFNTLCLLHAALAVPLLLYCYFFIADKPPGGKVPKALSAANLLKATIQVYKSPRTSLPGWVFMFHTSMYVALLTFVPRMAPNESIMNFLFIILPVSSMSGTFLSGILSQWVLKPPSLLMFAYLGILVTTVLAVMLQSYGYLFAGAAILLLLIAGTVQGSVFTLIPYLSRHESDQAMGNGSIAQFGNLGATIGPPMFAFSIDLFAQSGLLILIGGLSIAGCCVSVIARRI